MVKKKNVYEKKKERDKGFEDFTMRMIQVARSFN